MDIYVFGDQRVDCRTFLQDVLLCRESVLLTSFLDHVSVVLREEVSSMTHLRWGLDFPEFGHVRELVERYYKKGRSNPAIESAIVCLSQLAHFIRYEASTWIFRYGVLKLLTGSPKNTPQAISLLLHLLPIRVS